MFITVCQVAGNIAITQGINENDFAHGRMLGESAVENMAQQRPATHTRFTRPLNVFSWMSSRYAAVSDTAMTITCPISSAAIAVFTVLVYTQRKEFGGGSDARRSKNYGFCRSLECR